MIIKEIKKKLVKYLGFFLLSILLRTLKIDRCQIDFGRNLSKNGNNVIYAFWHSMMLTPGYTLRNLGIHVLVSQHRDGEYLTGIMTLFGLDTVRGSSTRGGARAMISLAKVARKGHSIIITPDGPRGPRLVVQPGVIFLAKKTGFPIIPISVNISNYWELPSWDRFVLPKPFARVTLTYGEPIHVARKIEDQELQKYCTVLKNELDKKI